MPGVVFFGYGDHAVAGLELLAELSIPVGALVLPWNRGGPDVAAAAATAARLGIPAWVQPRRPELPSFVSQLRHAAPDVILVWSYSQLLPSSILAIPRHGAVNVHGGLLPEYRGGHVKQWAIINGERESGATLHYMDEGIDTGPVIAEERFPLAADDDFATLGRSLQRAGVALLRRWLPAVLDGTAPRRPQDEHHARHWPMRTPEDGRIEWHMTAAAIGRLTRALVCNDPGAFVDVAGRRLSIRRAQVLPALVAGAAPGDVVADAGGVRVATAEGDVLISAVEHAGVAYHGGRLAALFRG